MASLNIDENLAKRTGKVIKYVAQGAIRSLFQDRSPELLIDGPAGTGKSRGAVEKLHLALMKYPKARGFMTRQTRASMTASCLQTYFKEVVHPLDKVHFNKNEQVVHYPNESELFIFGMDNEEKAKSSQYDIGYVCEATELVIGGLEMLTSRMRNGVIPYQQIMADCNPSFPQHWIKLRADRGVMSRIQSTHQDNPRLWNENQHDWTPEGKQYIARLDTLTGIRRVRLLEGKWAQAEGLVYPAFKQDVHLVNFMDLPMDWMEWPSYWSIDFGYKHPFVWQDWREDPYGRLWMVREIYMTKRLVEEHAQTIMEVCRGLNHPRAIICDHDAEGRATFEKYVGLPTLPAYKAITDGIQGVHNRLGHLKGVESNLPGIMLVRDSLYEVDEELRSGGRPTSTIQEFDSYVYPTKKKTINERKDELPEDNNNHGMDALRYVVAFVDDLATDPQEFETSVFFGEESYSISPY